MKTLKNRINLKIQIPKLSVQEEPQKSNQITKNSISQITDNIYISGYLIGTNISFLKNNKEKNNPLETKLSLDAKHFIPSYKQKDKDLDINADPYIPRNQNLKKKEEQTHPKKEVNQPVKKKESDLSKLLNSMDS